jgi:hypothetical protein
MVAQALLQVPPLTAWLSEVVVPGQADKVPVMADGVAATVTTAVATQPTPIEYVMVAVPMDMPVTIPVEDPMVATPGALLLQLPPAVASARVVVEPTQVFSVPVIGAGVATTVTTWNA